MAGESFRWLFLLVFLGKLFCIFCAEFLTMTLYRINLRRCELARADLRRRYGDAF